MPALTDAQREEIAAMLAEARPARRGAFGDYTDADEDKPLDNNNNFRDQEIGYFQPDLPEEQGKGDIVTVGSDIFFRDVYTFIDRLKDAVAYRGEARVKNRIPALLRGRAQVWFTSSLGEAAKAGLRHSPGMDLWYTTLEEMFKAPLAQSMDRLQKCRYSLRDAVEGRDIDEYVMTVQRLSKHSNFGTVLQQLTLAHSRIDANLKQGIPSPTADTTPQDYIRTLRERSDDWRVTVQPRTQGLTPHLELGTRDTVLSRGRDSHASRA